MSDAPKTDHHWCDAEAKEWAAEYFKRITKGGSFLARLQLLAHRHFYGALPAGFVGDMPSSAEVSRAGEQGENVELRVNWLRAHQNAKHQIIVAPRMAWSGQPINTDSKSMAGASRGANILEAEWKQGPWEQTAIDCQKNAGIYGEEFLFPYWLSVGGKAKQYIEPVEAQEAMPGTPPRPPDPSIPGDEGDPGSEPTEAVAAAPGRIEYEGDLECNQVASWNAFCDEWAPSWDASMWQSARIPRDRHDLIAQYPHMRDEILAAPEVPLWVTASSNGNTVTYQSLPDKVLCHYFFHKRTPGLPEGLQCVALSPDCVLEFLPLETCYRKGPIKQCPAALVKGSPRGYSDFWEAMAAQDLATNIQSSIATNIVAFAKQMISAEEGTNLAIDQIGNGPFVQYRPRGSQPPEPMTFHMPSDGAFKHLGELKADQRMMLGLNDVAMGEAPTGTPNAQAWALLATAGVTANSGGQRLFVDFVRKVGQTILGIWKEKASEKRKTAVVGVHGAAVPRQEEWDKEDMGALEDVTVEIANPLAQTAAGRLQIEALYAERGFVQVPEQTEMLLETGTLQPLTQVLRDELIYIAWENEQILKGICPPVRYSDSHQMHIREHKGPTFSADARGGPMGAEINTAADEHIQMHVEQAMSMTPQMAQLLGQASTAPAAPPGGPEGVPAALEQPGQPGDAPEGIKLPTAPTNPATGAPVGAPGLPT